MGNREDVRERKKDSQITEMGTMTSPTPAFSRLRHSDSSIMQPKLVFCDPRSTLPFCPPEMDALADGDGACCQMK